MYPYERRKRIVVASNFILIKIIFKKTYAGLHRCENEVYPREGRLAFSLWLKLHNGHKVRVEKGGWNEAEVNALRRI